MIAAHIFERPYRGASMPLASKALSHGSLGHRPRSSKTHQTERGTPDSTQRLLASECRANEIALSARDISPSTRPQAEHKAAPLAIGEKQRRFAERPPNYFINRAERLRLISRVILR